MGGSQCEDHNGRITSGGSHKEDHIGRITLGGSHWEDYINNYIHKSITIKK